MQETTHREDVQLVASGQNLGEGVCIESEDDHRHDELDDPDGNEALGIYGEMLAASWLAGGIVAIHC